jgi:hypothetical protein
MNEQMETAGWVRRGDYWDKSFAVDRIDLATLQSLTLAVNATQYFGKPARSLLCMPPKWERVGDRYQIHCSLCEMSRDTEGGLRVYSEIDFSRVIARCQAEYQSGEQTRCDHGNEGVQSVATMSTGSE